MLHEMVPVQVTIPDAGIVYWRPERVDGPYEAVLLSQAVVEDRLFTWGLLSPVDNRAVCQFLHLTDDQWIAGCFLYPFRITGPGDRHAHGDVDMVRTVLISSDACRPLWNAGLRPSAGNTDTATRAEHLYVARAVHAWGKPVESPLRRALLLPVYKQARFGLNALLGVPPFPFGILSAKEGDRFRQLRSEGRLDDAEAGRCLIPDLVQKIDDAVRVEILDRPEKLERADMPAFGGNEVVRWVEDVLAPRLPHLPGEHAATLAEPPPGWDLQPRTVRHGVLEARPGGHVEGRDTLSVYWAELGGQLVYAGSYAEVGGTGPGLMLFAGAMDRGQALSVLRATTTDGMRLQLWTTTGRCFYVSGLGDLVREGFRQNIADLTREVSPEVFRLLALLALHEGEATNVRRLLIEPMNELLPVTSQRAVAPEIVEAEDDDVPRVLWDEIRARCGQSVAELAEVENALEGTTVGPVEGLRRVQPRPSPTPAL